MSVLTITNENFKTAVLGSDRPVLLDFWAEWCGPCAMLSPVVDKLSDEMPDIVFGKVNVDEQPQLAAAFGISSIPTLIAFKDGSPAAKSVGVVPKESIIEMLREM